MSCESVQERISSHLDGMLTGHEQENVLAHLESCRACSARWKSLLALRTGLRRLDRPRVPAHLAVQLRVLASHERVRQLARASFGARIQYWAARAKLVFDNLMRPVAVPVAGGIVSALLLFAMLNPNLSFAYKVGSEPPLFSTEADGQVVDWMNDFPRLESAGAEMSSDQIALELTIDEQGRVADYAVSQGQLTPEMQNIILFSRFTPAMFFGKPTWGKKLIFFRIHPKRARG